MSTARPEKVCRSDVVAGYINGFHNTKQYFYQTKKRFSDKVEF